MLFRDFFPRLQETAARRYGEVVSKRQFEDWREDGLLPGPGAPIGRGRGRSPDRRWPLASYRRALRICRYKSWGARRQSQWWLGLWLSGETVAPAIIRKSLKREASIERRASRSFIESNRWRNKTFATLADAEYGGMGEAGQLAGLLKLFNATPDQHRRIAICELEDSSAHTEVIFSEFSPLFFEMSAEEAAAVRADVGQDEIVRALRPGHLSEEYRDGSYIIRLSTNEIEECLAIHRSRREIALLSCALIWCAGVPKPEHLARALILSSFREAKFLSFHVSLLLRIAFELDSDSRENRPHSWRLNGVREKVAEITALLQEHSSQFRQNLILFLEQQRDSGATRDSKSRQ